MTNPIEFDIDHAYRDHVPTTELLTLLEGVLAVELAEAVTQIAIRITGDEFLQELNLTHRGIDAPTDVLSFPTGEVHFPAGEDDEIDSYLGDIAISVPAMYRNAKLTGTPPDRELRHLVTHGVLHLLGYDHESDENQARMRGREVALLGDWVNAIWDAPPTH